MSSQIAIEKSTKWQESHKDINLDGDVVDIWYGSLKHALNVSNLIKLLSLQERNRAKRFIFDIDRERSIARRVILRLILSVYVGIKPSEVVIETNTHGKPEIKSKSDGCVFSYSCSKDRIIYAISKKNRKLGIDLEHSESLETESILSTLFPHKMLKSFKDQYDVDHMKFYYLWTSLEAYLKATGTGFTQALDEEFWKSFPIDLHTLRRKDINWSIVRLIPEPGLFGTLMINSPETEFVFRNFSNALEWEPNVRNLFSGE